jgi:hypothetical protein
MFSLGGKVLVRTADGSKDGVPLCLAQWVPCRVIQ